MAAEVSLDPRVAARLADRIARAVTGVPGVVRLSRGPLGTFLADRTVPGVALRDGTVQVSVVGRHGVPLVELAEAVRGEVRKAAPGLAVDVMIDDIE